MYFRITSKYLPPATFFKIFCQTQTMFFQKSLKYHNSVDISATEGAKLIRSATFLTSSPVWMLRSNRVRSQLIQYFCGNKCYRFFFLDRKLTILRYINSIFGRTCKFFSQNKKLTQNLQKHLQRVLLHDVTHGFQGQPKYHFCWP